LSGKSLECGGLLLLLLVVSPWHTDVALGSEALEAASLRGGGRGLLADDLIRGIAVTILLLALLGLGFWELE
jgi:hypothetical protein